MIRWTLYACLLALLPLKAQSKVYDCFLFCNELEILAIRLHEMNDNVDQFVLVESIETFRGNPKPLIFKENLHLFENFQDKIIHVTLERPYDTNNPWDREAFQRNQILRGLISCEDDDVIFISDVDEIIKKEDVMSLCNALKETSHPVVGASQYYHSNYLNSAPSSDLWRGTVATSYKHLKNSSPQSLRGMKDQALSVAGGWHFSWVGGIEKVLYKLGAYSHAESDTPEVRASKIYDAGQKYPGPVLEINEYFPDYVQENQSFFIENGFIYPKED